MTHSVMIDNNERNFDSKVTNIRYPYAVSRYTTAFYSFWAGDIVVVKVENLKNKLTVYKPAGLKMSNKTYTLSKDVTKEHLEDGEYVYDSRRTEFIYDLTRDLELDNFYMVPPKDIKKMLVVQTALEKEMFPAKRVAILERTDDNTTPELASLGNLSCSLLKMKDFYPTDFGCEALYYILAKAHGFGNWVAPSYVHLRDFVHPKKEHSVMSEESVERLVAVVANLEKPEEKQLLLPEPENKVLLSKIIEDGKFPTFKAGNEPVQVIIDTHFEGMSIFKILIKGDKLVFYTYDKSFYRSHKYDDFRKMLGDVPRWSVEIEGGE